jgi:hypothetical protein
MKTFKQLVNESLEKKPYELYKGPFLYFNQEGTVLEIKDGFIKNVIGLVSKKNIEKYFPNGKKLVLALIGGYLQYLFPDDEDARSLTDREYASWYIIRNEQLDRNVDPKLVAMGRQAEWLVPATIDLGYEGWNLDKDVKDIWRPAMKHL